MVIFRHSAVSLRASIRPPEPHRLDKHKKRDIFPPVWPSVFNKTLTGFMSLAKPTTLSRIENAGWEVLVNIVLFCDGRE